MEQQSPAPPASAGKSPGNGIIRSTRAHRRDVTACGRTRHRGHCCGREPGQGNYRYPAAAGPSGAEQSMLAGGKHHCVHTHVISQPLPTTAGPSACRFPRTEPGMQHVWAPSCVWGSQQRVRAWTGVFAPVGRSAWLGAGARHSSAPGALQRWERGRAGGTCPSHSSSISAAVPVGRKTPGCFYLLAVPPLSDWLAQDHVCRGQDQLCCWAALQLCLRVRESEKSQGNPPQSAFVGPCTTECWPDPGLFLPKAWAEVGRRGSRGARLTEKNEKRCVAHSTPVSLLPALVFLITACWQFLPTVLLSSGCPNPTHPTVQWGSPGNRMVAGVWTCCSPPKSGSPVCSCHSHPPALGCCCKIPAHLPVSCPLPSLP